RRQTRAAARSHSRPTSLCPSGSFHPLPVPAALAAAPIALVVLVALHLFDCAELCPVFAGADATGGQRALFGGGRVGPDGPAHSRCASHGIVGTGIALAFEGCDQLAILRRFSGFLEIAAVFHGR